MNRRIFNLLFFLVVVPLKIIDVYLIYPQKFIMFFSNPVESIIYNIDDIIQFATLWYSPAISFIVLLIISLFRFKYIWMSRWYSLALLVPIWNLYLIYKLITSNNDIKINKEDHEVNSKELKIESKKIDNEINDNSNNIDSNFFINIIIFLAILFSAISWFIVIKQELENEGYSRE